MPISVAPASRAISVSTRSCASTRASTPASTAASIIIPRFSRPSTATMSSTASAPKALASHTWAGCNRKSFLSTGIETASLTSARSSSEPSKCRGSVSTLMALAPALS